MTPGRVKNLWSCRYHWASHLPASSSSGSPEKPGQFPLGSGRRGREILVKCTRLPHNKGLPSTGKDFARALFHLGEGNSSCSSFPVSLERKTKEQSTNKKYRTYASVKTQHIHFPLFFLLNTSKISGNCI